MSGFLYHGRPGVAPPDDGTILADFPVQQQGGLATAPMAPCGAPGRCAIIQQESTMHQSCAFQNVDAVRPATGYIGGKKQLGRRVAAIIDQLPLDLSMPSLSSA